MAIIDTIVDSVIRKLWEVQERLWLDTKNAIKITEIEVERGLFPPGVIELNTDFGCVKIKGDQPSTRQERTYTKSELYQYVAEYAKEANDEGFDMSVGDFVDWVVSREENPPSPSNEEDVTIPRKILFSRGIYDEHPPACLLCGVTKDKHGISSAYCPMHEYEKVSKDISNPVLPEKLAIHSSRNYRDPEEILDILLETQAAVNGLIDYLKEKNL